MKQLKEFWQDNKKGYLITGIVTTLCGFIVYAMTTSNYTLDKYLVLIPFIWFAEFILAFGIHSLMYKKE